MLLIPPILLHIISALLVTLIGFVISDSSNAYLKKWVKKNQELKPVIVTALLSILLVVIISTLNCKDPCEQEEKKDTQNNINAYFEQIRNSEVLLTAFFSGMPKGGDLHNHLSGSVYAESFLENAINRKLWIDPVSLKIEDNPRNVKPSMCRLDTFCTSKAFPDVKQRLFLEWSVKDYFDAYRASDKHFFDAFGKFPPNVPWTDLKKALQELRNRAIVEHTQYLEVMFGGIPLVNDTPQKHIAIDEALRNASVSYDMKTAQVILSNLYPEITGLAKKSARTFIDSLEKIHVNINDSAFTMLYQVSVSRNANPVDVFKKLLAAFMAADQSSIVVGVNIVSREDGDISMRDYALHMQMFKFLHEKYPKVKYSLHAGELTIGLVKPEDLSWHINDAVFTAKGLRIGHGIDIAYEKDVDKLLRHMSDNKIAVEINLVSNQFILKVRDDRHPLMLYVKNNVPVVISTDDAGILRSNHIEQFVWLAKRYPEISYEQIKQFIRNSIEYSFIKDESMKRKLAKELDEKILAFENKILSTH